jgi:hypothetical protein
MKYTIYGCDHKWRKSKKFSSLLEVANFIRSNYDAADLCCVEDECGYGYNPEELLEEEAA